MCILQHVKQCPTHSKCVIHNLVGVEQSEGQSEGHQRRARTSIPGKEGKRIHGGLGTGLHTMRWLSLQLQINGEDAVHTGKEAVSPA